MNKYSDWHDEQLVKSFCHGDNAAFETLLLRHKDRVYTYIYNLTHNAPLADDIFQETFIKAIDTIKSGNYSSEGKFLAWVLRIAHNNVIDHYRRAASDKTISNSDDTPDVFNRMELCDTSHHEAVERENSLRQVEHLITLLPDEQQRIVLMRYYRDLSFKEIADIESISINTALGRMRYALINMRKMITTKKLTLCF
ncbi:MAG: RNA polymerase sigma factor [Candidatus Aphodosoma sp.]